MSAVANGRATLTTGLLPSGSHSIKAYYGGDSQRSVSYVRRIPRQATAGGASTQATANLIPVHN